jgi:hypothetical protein
MIEVVSNANILAKHLIDAGRKKRDEQPDEMIYLEM